MASLELVPQKLNWVEARAACSVYKIFDDIQNGLDEDITAINKARKLDEDSQFSMSPLSGGTTVVISQSGVYPSERVKIGIFEDYICAEDMKVGRKWKATVRLNDAGRCVLWLDSVPIEQWQFRKMVLQRLFFGDE